MKKALISLLGISVLMLTACVEESQNEEQATTTEETSNEEASKPETSEEIDNDEETETAQEDEPKYNEYGLEYGYFSETYSTQAADYKFIEVNLYEDGLGGYDEAIFELVYEITNNTDELATPEFLAQWDFDVVIDTEDYVESVNERVPYLEEHEVDEEVIQRNESNHIKPGGTVTHSIWYEYHADQMYISMDEAGMIIPIEF